MRIEGRSNDEVWICSGSGLGSHMRAIASAPLDPHGVSLSALNEVSVLQPLHRVNYQAASNPLGVSADTTEYDATNLIMSTPSPTYERPSLQGGFRRSFTLPARALSHHEKAGLDPSDSAAELLYSHPSARIIKFSPPTDTIRSVSSPVSHDLDYPVDTIETLPWASRTEMPMAHGLMIIEKVRGSTNFLKCGTVMHAILRNSQCWCVDGESKFVMRVGKFQYYRIELPTQTEKEKEKVAEFKAILKKILRFEITPCPFKRGFHVELPESATTPRRKGTWKRRDGSQPSTPTDDTPSPLTRGKSSKTWVPQLSTPLRRSSKDNEYGFPESSGETEGPIAFDPARDSRNSSPSGSDASEDTMEERQHSESEEDSGVQSDRPEHRTVDAADERDRDEASMADESRESSAEFVPQVTTEAAKASATGPEHIVATDMTNANSTVDTDLDEPVEKRATESNDDHIAESIGEQVAELVTQRHAPPIEAQPPDEHVAESIEECVADTVEKDDVEPTEELQIAPIEKHEAQPVQDRVHAASERQVDEENEDHFGGNANGDIDNAQEGEAAETLSVVSSVVSFQSFESDDNRPPSPTPLAEQRDPFDIHMKASHKRDLSEMTITPSNPDSQSPNSERPRTATSDRPSTPLLDHGSASDGSWPEVETPSGYTPEFHLRQRLKARQSLFPPTQTSTVFVPSPQQNRQNHLTAAMLQKACSVAVGKPIELVFMLFHVLAEIARGATVADLMNGRLWEKSTQRRDHNRNQNLPDQMDGTRDDSEDDYGIPIRGRPRGSDQSLKDDDADSLFDLD